MLMPTKIMRRLRLRVPIATSNLGAGLDALSLALKLYVNLTVELLDRNDLQIPLVRLRGRACDRTQDKERADFTYKLVNSFWREDNDIFRRMRLTVETDVPIGCGLGVMSAAITGALWAACLLQDLVPTNSELLAYATRYNTGLDFLSASLMGNLVISSHWRGQQKPLVQQVVWPEKWKLLLLLPNTRLHDHQSIGVLPPQLSREEHVDNLQAVAHIVAALCRHDETAFRQALPVSFHQSHRTVLVPAFAEIAEITATLPALGCVLSGAGPAIVIFVHQRHQAQVTESLTMLLADHPTHRQLICTEAAANGVELLHQEQGSLPLNHIARLPDQTMHPFIQTSDIALKLNRS